MVGSGSGIAPLRLSASQDDLEARLGFRQLIGPGPCFGRQVLKLAPSHDKVASQLTLKDNCLYFMCIPLWARTGAFFITGLTLLLLGFFTGRAENAVVAAAVGDYFNLDSTTRAGFQNWRASPRDPCASPGGEFRVFYLYSLNDTSVEPVRAAIGGGVYVKPVVHELGPYYYAVTWNYTVSGWTDEKQLLTYIPNEDLVFCPGGPTPQGPDTPAYERPWVPGMASDDTMVSNIGLAYQAGNATGSTVPFTPVDYVVTKPVREWVHGYIDQTLSANLGAGTVRSPVVSPLQHNFTIPSQTDHSSPGDGRPPRNCSAQVWTGVKSGEEFLGYLNRVQNSSHAQVCPAFPASADAPACEDAWPCDPGLEECPLINGVSALGYINGSLGQRFPWRANAPSMGLGFNGPLTCRNTLSLWVPSLLRSVVLQCNESTRDSLINVVAMPIAGEDLSEGDEIGDQLVVNAIRFVISPDAALPYAERPINRGYDMECFDDVCSPWIWNMTAARQAPIFITNPRFANSSFELNVSGCGDDEPIADCGVTRSNVQGLEPPDDHDSFSWLGVEVHSGARLRGALRLQTNVYVTGPPAAPFEEPWMVPIGRVSYEHNATNATIDNIHGLAYGDVARVLARAAQVSLGVAAFVFFCLCIGHGVKYWEMERGLVKMKNKSLGRTSAAANFIKRSCLRAGLCGPDRGEIIRRLKEMKEEELLSPLLAAGHEVAPRAAQIQEDAPLVKTPGRRRTATDADQIEVHFGQLEQMSSEESGDDAAPEDDTVHEIYKLDSETWDDLVMPPGRSRVERWANFIELMPWICWWLFGILPKAIVSQRTLLSEWWLWPFQDTRALVLAAFVSVIVVSLQVLRRFTTAKKDRVFVLVPTVIDISTLVMFCISALVASLIEQPDQWDFWPAITHGTMLVVAAVSTATGHPFIISVYCREMRPEIWRERIVTRLAEVVSVFWCIILFLVTILQAIPLLATRMPGAEVTWLTAAIPGALLLGATLFTVWYSMQVETELVKALNRLLRKGTLRSRRDAMSREEDSASPASRSAIGFTVTDGTDGFRVPTEGVVDVRTATLSPTNSSISADGASPFPSFSSAVVPPGEHSLPHFDLDQSTEVSGQPPPGVKSWPRVTDGGADGAPHAMVPAAAPEPAPAPEPLSVGASMEVADDEPSLEPFSTPGHAKKSTDDATSSVPSTVERADRQFERTSADIQESVAAALAKSSTISAQLMHATSIDDTAALTAVTYEDLQASAQSWTNRRGSVASMSSISSDEFHDAEGEDHPQMPGDE